MPAISPTMRDYLIDHLSGPVEVQTHNARTRIVALRLGFVVPDAQGMRFWIGDKAPPPRTTEITEKGRAVLAAEIAGWLDAALRAEVSKDQTIIDALTGARDPAEQPSPTHDEEAVEA